MRLSILIPSYNRADLLAECLASVCRFAPAGSEILVVDDGSPDHAVSHTAHRFGVAVVRQARAGFCAAANAGIAQVRGDVVEILNDDTVVSPGWADAALTRFADARVAAVTPLVLRGPPQTPERVDSAGDDYWLGGVARKRWHGEPLAAKHLVPGEVFGANGTGSFFRRAALMQAGGFPEEFVAYFDDIDLSFRLRRAGGRIVYEPSSRIHHRVSMSYGKPGGDLLALQSRNEELVFWRNVPARRMLVALPLHLAVLAGKSARRLREGQFAPFARGRWDALMHLWRAGCRDAAAGIEQTRIVG